MGFAMKSLFYCWVVWTMVADVQGGRGLIMPALAKGWGGEDSSSNNENEIGAVTVAARTPLAKGWQGQNSSRNNEIDIGTARTARKVTCVRCIDSVCKPHFWDPETEVERQGRKSNCDVCYKRVVNIHNQIVGGLRGLEVDTTSIRRGCLSMKEVEARELTVGECSKEDVAGDEFTSHYQCLCNDRDLCNSSRSLKVNTDTIGLIFILCCLALIFN